MEINFKSNDKKEAYTWVGKTLGKFYYFSESKKNKGIIKSYVINMTGYSSGNVGKLIAKKKQLGVLRLGERTQNTFATFYTNEDIALLAKEKISEYFLERALAEAFAQFPFGIIIFHSDNGSEYINKTVSRLLKQAYIEQTKSRSRHSNDNALVEGKNASTLRKQLGHAHIPQKFAPLINTFCVEHLNPFLNFYRPCAFATEKIGNQGKVRKRYQASDYAVPIDRLLTINNIQDYLKKGVTIEGLKKQKLAKSHLAVAEEVSEANLSTPLFCKIGVWITHFI